MPKLTATPHEIPLENSAPPCAVKPAEHANPAKVPDDDSRGTASPPTSRQSGEPRLRVLHVIDRMGLGGTEAGILKVIQGLGSECFEHRLCTIRGYDENF